MTSLQKTDSTYRKYRSEVATIGTVEVPKPILDCISRNLGKGSTYTDIRNSNSVNLHH